MGVFGDRLRTLRIARGEIQADVAALLNISVASYSAYEGAREPSYERLRMLANHYGVTVDYLVGNSDLRNPENQALTDELGLSEECVDIFKKWKDYPIGRYLQNNIGLREHPDFKWSEVFCEFVETEGFGEFIVLMGQRLHPDMKDELSKTIATPMKPERFTMYDAFDALIQDTLKGLILKMSIKKLKEREDRVGS